MGNKKKNQKKVPKKKPRKTNCNENAAAGSSQLSIPNEVAKGRPTRNKASMKMFECKSSSGQSTPDPFSDDGEYGSDKNYDPGYDDDSRSTSTVSEPKIPRNSRQRITTSDVPRPDSNNTSCTESGGDVSDEDTEGSDDDTSESDTESTSEASSNESIFDTSNKRSYPSTSKNYSAVEPKTKKPKLASAEDSMDTMSVNSEVLMNNIDNLNLDRSSVLPDTAELENMSICTHIERNFILPVTSQRCDDPETAAQENCDLATPPLSNPVDVEGHHTPTSPSESCLGAGEENRNSISQDAAMENHNGPASPSVPDPDAAEGNHGPASPSVPDPNAAEGNHGPASPSAPDPDAAEGNHGPASPSAPDPDAAEGNHGPASPSAPDPDAAEGNHGAASPSAPRLDAVEGNNAPVSPSAPDPDAAEGNHGPASPSAQNPDAVEGNHEAASPSAPRLDAVDGNNAPVRPSAPDLDAAEESHGPASPSAPNPDAVEGNHGAASHFAPRLDAVDENNAPVSPSALDADVAEGNHGPASPLAPDLDAAEENQRAASPSAPTPDSAERNDGPASPLAPNQDPVNENRPITTPTIPTYEWENTTSEIPVFEFDESSEGVQFNAGPGVTVIEIFNKLFPSNIIDYIVTCTNAYGRALCEQRRPATRNSRNYNFKDTNREEILKFLGLCLLMGQVKIPNKRKMFTYSDPLYYHPVFHYVMSARRFEQILRSIYTSELGAKGKDKMEKFIDALTKNFRECYKPSQNLSLDESLLLFRGRLSFRQYIKSKKARYGIKFFELTTSDGYVLNILMYTGKSANSVLQTGKKTEKVVLRLMRPYLLKGHHLYMDNYYNSVTLSQKLLYLKTHTSGTLRAKRKDNPKHITNKKLKKNQHVWVRKNKVYVSKWVDKRPVLMITTLIHPKLIEVQNRFGQKKIKPAEVAEYNQYMSGIDRADQMISYYSSPRKSLRWYKKVLFHLLDVTVWNAFFIFRKYCQDKCDFLLFREELIRTLIDLPSNIKAENLVLARSKYDNRLGPNVSVPTKVTDDVGAPSDHGHWPEKNPVREGSNKTSKYYNII